MTYKIPRPPDSYSYLLAAKRLDADFRNGRPMNTALADGLEQLSTRDVRQYMFRAYQWGEVIEQHDRSLGIVDQRRLVTTSFAQGSAAGLLLTRQAHQNVVTGTAMVDLFDTLTFSSADDINHEKHLLAEEVVELSELGLMALGKGVAEVIETWEERSTPDVTKQIMFRRGIGMTAFLAYRVHKTAYDAQEQAALRQHVRDAEAGTIDWDIALRNMDDL